MPPRYIPLNGNSRAPSQSRYRLLAGASSSASPATNPSAPSPLAGSGSQSGVDSGAAVGNVSAMGFPSLPGATLGFGPGGFYGGLTAGSIFGGGGYNVGQSPAQGNVPSLALNASPAGVGVGVQTGLGPQVDQATNSMGKAVAGTQGVPTGIGWGGLLGMAAPAAGSFLSAFANPFSALFGTMQSINNLAEGIPGTTAHSIAAINADPTLNATQKQEAIAQFFAQNPGAAPQVGGPQPIGLQPFDAPVANVNASTMAAPTVAATSLADMTTAGIFGSPAGTRGDTAISLSDAARGALAATGREDNADPTANAPATAPTAAALGELGINTDLTAESAGTGIGTGTGPGNAGPGSVSAGGVANAGNTGVGQANDASTSAAAGEGGGGGGGGGGGCRLVSYAMTSLRPQHQHQTKRAMNVLHALLMKQPHGRQLFALYQKVAAEIIAKADAAGVGDQVKYALRKSLIIPSHGHARAKDLNAAQRTFTTVVTDLARRFRVPLPSGRYLAIGAGGR